jgi:hypothetical protein
MVIWQRHANYVNETYWDTNNYPFKELYGCVVVKLKPFNTWYFGTIAQKLDIKNYLIISERIFREMLSKIGIIFLILGFFAVIKKEIDIFFYIWFLSVICSIILVFNLNIVHNFYQMPLTPILSIFCGAGLAYFIDFFRNKKVAFAVTAILVSFYIFMSWTFAVKFFNETNDWVEVGRFIDSSTEKNAMIATSTSSTDNWDPTLMYYSDRHGFNVPHMRLNEEMIDYLRGKDVQYLAIVDYKGGNDSINSAISPYRPVVKNGRLIIYDISTGKDTSVK